MKPTTEAGRAFVETYDVVRWQGDNTRHDVAALILAIEAQSYARALADVRRDVEAEWSSDPEMYGPEWHGAKFAVLAILDRLAEPLAEPCRHPEQDPYDEDDLP